MVSSIWSNAFHERPCGVFQRCRLIGGTQAAEQSKTKIKTNYQSRSSAATTFLHDDDDDDDDDATKSRLRAGSSM